MYKTVKPQTRNPKIELLKLMQVHGCDDYLVIECVTLFDTATK